MYGNHHTNGVTKKISTYSSTRHTAVNSIEWLPGNIDNHGFYVDDIYEPYQVRNDTRFIYYMSPQQELHSRLEFPEVGRDFLEKRQKFIEEGTKRSQLADE